MYFPAAALTDRRHLPAAARRGDAAAGSRRRSAGGNVCRMTTLLDGARGGIELDATQCAKLLQH
jgi:hypothetical protein